MEPKQLPLNLKDNLVNTPHEKYIQHEIERVLTAKNNLQYQLQMCNTYLERLYEDRKKYV